MQATKTLLERALKKQPAPVWRELLELSEDAISVAKHHGRLSPVMAGGCNRLKRALPRPGEDRAALRLPGPRFILSRFHRHELHHGLPWGLLPHPPAPQAGPPVDQ